MNKQIQKVLLLGSGAIKIGEAGEFDYSGTQAIKALKEEGVRVILVNPNVATIQTSEGLADEVYFLPITAEFVSRVIAKEKPGGVLLGFGGQTALNCGLELANTGVFEKFGVKVLGTPIQAIAETEDRDLFAKRLTAIGLSAAKGQIVSSIEQGFAVAASLGYPVMVRAGFALGGSGSGIARSTEELARLLTMALVTTPQIIVEECLWGWKEIEYEVVRDRADNCITVCNMENFDPVGIHTGESIVVAPAQTLNNDEYYSLRSKSIATIRALGIIGECNIQFALDPTNGELRVIEVNARLSRSSALASKATGYPLAYVAAKLALGKTLPELTNKVTGRTSAYFEPALDYVVVKIPRWDLDKFPRVDKTIGSEMKSVGEVMSIARSFEEAVQKAARMLADGYEGVVDPRFGNEVKSVLIKDLKTTDSLRLFRICSALRAGVTVKQIHKITGIDPWFLQKLVNIVNYAQTLSGRKPEGEGIKQAKMLGFSDRQIALYTKSDELKVRKQREKLGIRPFVKQIDTLAGEFPTVTNYLYLTYNAESNDIVLTPNQKNKVIVLGCGPYAIGTSVEFDWGAVMTSRRLRELGYSTVIINCNPETVSTDYDISDTLYFEELTLERVLDIYAIEKSPFILSVGGQIPNNLAPKLAALNIPTIGTKVSQIVRAEDRQKFSKLLDELDIPQPFWREVRTTAQARNMARNLGYPLLIRPSFVLSGKGMAVIENQAGLEHYLKGMDVLLRHSSLVISKYFARARECDVDAVAQNGKILAMTICEHIEGAGVHSGDSTMVLPADGIEKNVQNIVHDYAKKIIRALSVAGPVNIQYIIKNGEVFVIECNLRSSRSFPFTSKVTRVNFISLATDVAVGRKVAAVKLPRPAFYAVKAPQFSFHKLRGADPVTGVEMSSTGEVVGFGRTKEEAYLSAALSAGFKLSKSKSAYVCFDETIDKIGLLEVVRKLCGQGFTIYSKKESLRFFNDHGLSVIDDANNPAELFRKKFVDLVISDFDIEYAAGNNFHLRAKNYAVRRMAVDFGASLLSVRDLIDLYARAISMYDSSRLQVSSWNEWISGLSVDKTGKFNYTKNPEPLKSAVFLWAN